MKRASSCQTQLLLGSFTQKHCVGLLFLCDITVNTVYMRRWALKEMLINSSIYKERCFYFLSFARKALNSNKHCTELTSNNNLFHHFLSLDNQSSLSCHPPASCIPPLLPPHFYFSPCPLSRLLSRRSEVLKFLRL